MKTIVIRPLTSELSSDYLDFFDTFIKKQDLLKLPGKKNVSASPNDGPSGVN
jgi:hypothetical protein